MPLKLTNTNAAYNGHTVPFADLRSGRAYGGHTVPSAPTAFPTKANCEEFVFRSTGEGPTETSEKLPKDRNPSFRISCEKEKH